MLGAALGASVEVGEKVGSSVGVTVFMQVGHESKQLNFCKSRSICTTQECSVTLVRHSL